MNLLRNGHLMRMERRKIFTPLVSILETFLFLVAAYLLRKANLIIALDENNKNQLSANSFLNRPATCEIMHDINNSIRRKKCYAEDNN